MPHCPRPLYEAIIANNFTPDARYVVLGNDLRDYLPGQPATSEFVKPKKKRKEKATWQPRETVLSRMVPHFDIWPLSELPDTHLPGFARAFLSLAFHWIARPDDIDWASELPRIDFPDDNELL